MYQLQCVLDVFIHQVGNTANTTEGFQILFLDTSPSMAQIISLTNGMMTQIFCCMITISTIAQ